MLEFEIAPPRADERTTLLAMLDMQRATVLWKLDGLSLEDAKRPLVESGTSLLGSIKHLAYVEKWWFEDFIAGGSPENPYSEKSPDGEWRIEEGETIEGISKFYVDAVEASNVIINNAPDLDVLGSMDVGPEHRRQRSLRWVLVHMVEETARHAGQMDIMRELVDNATGYYPE